MRPAPFPLLCFLLFTFPINTHATELEPASPASARVSLERNWHLQSACKLNDGGDKISRPEYNAQSWLQTTVPHTVLGAQVDAKLFPDPFYGMNLRAIPG